jgi:monoamine oxidase
VIVVGGGLAGLAAAARLVEAGREVTLIEARERLGGRVHTVHEDGLVIELGAEFLHGAPAEVEALLRDAGLDIVEEGAAGDAEDAEDAGFFGDIAAFCRAAAGAPDLGVAAFAGTLGPDWAGRVGGVLGYVGGFHAADVTRMSVHALVEAERAQGVGSAPPRTVRGGFDRLADALAERIGHDRLRLGAPVHGIEWAPGRVRVRAVERGVPFAVDGAAAVVTLPVGVLQADALAFDPTLPRKIEAARDIGVGPAVRVVLRLRAPVPEGFHQSQGAFPVAWSGGRTVVAWAGGPAADLLHGLGGEALAKAAIAALEGAIGLDLADNVVGWSHHDWLDDPFSMGAYSYAIAGAADAWARLAEPVQGTLFFAGEATCAPGVAATVHGAILSGWRAADQVLAVARG